MSSPAADPCPHLSSTDATPPAALDMDSLERIADHLRGKFNLTLFGFDVIVGAADSVMYVIDVNYFPHFKGLTSAPGFVRAALKQAYAAHQRSAWTDEC